MPEGSEEAMLRMDSLELATSAMIAAQSYALIAHLP